MKQITFYLSLLVFLLGSAFKAVSQINFEGSDAYGRMYNVFFDQTQANRLYGAALGNHIMKSEDLGENWEIFYTYPENGTYLEHLTPLTGELLAFILNYSADMAANSVKILDVNSGEIIRSYAPPLTAGASYTWIDSYAVFPTNPDIALVHQSYKIGLSGFSKVYYTTDGGITWRLVYYNVTNNGVFPNNVAISPSNPQKLFIARGSGPNDSPGGLLISEDEGLTWTEHMAGVTFSAITFHPENADNILLGTFIGPGVEGHDENLFRSLDGGATWSIIPVDWEDGVMNNITGIVYNPLDHNNILVMEENEVVITLDNWQTHTKQVYPVDNLDDYYYGVFASFNPFQNGELIVSANYYPLFSNDGGQSFTRILTPFYVSALPSIQIGDDVHVYHSVQRGLLHKNLTTGELIEHDVEGVNIFYNYDAPVYFTDRKTVGRIYKYESSFTGNTLQISNDFGYTYTSIHTNFYDQFINISVDPSNPNILWVMFLHEGGVIIDVSDMNNPQTTYVSLPINEVLTDVYIDENNSDLIFIAVANRVYRSTNGGVSWENRSNGLSIPYSDIIFDIEKRPGSNSVYFVTASNGIFKTEDDGGSWQRVSSSSNVQKIEFSPINPNHVVATVPSGDGINSHVLYSTNGGNSWIALPFEAIAYVGSLGMAYKFNEDSVDAYIASYDLGLIKYTLDLSSVSVPSHGQKAPFVIYPNPAQHFINIQDLENRMTSVHIYNSLGQEVLKSGNQKELDIRALPSGAYFVRIQSSDGSFFVKRILKE